jgi:tetrathionate reductase subunit B
MGKVLIIDITRCNGCHNCQVACKDEHVGNDWSPVARPQPLAGQFWTRVKDTVRGTVPKVKVTYNHTICQHCREAPCITACPKKAIYRRPDGIVIIDPLKCTGSKKCIEACPYEGVIYFNEEINISQKCTFCAHLLDKGWKETRCSDVCPTGAFTFGEEADLKDKIAQAEALRPELNTGPRVYYIGLTKRFIGGTVYDPEADEIIAEAEVTIVNPANKSKMVKTDEFGDFWLDGLLPGKCSVTISKKGYKIQCINADITDNDVNLGDIAMTPEKNESNR